MANVPEWDRLLAASMKNNVDEIYRLIKEEGIPPSHGNVVGQTALHIAAFWGNVEAIQAILDCAIEGIEEEGQQQRQKQKLLHARNRMTGATPLHCAAQSSKGSMKKRIEAAKLLIAEGADPAMQDDRGAAPLEYVDTEQELQNLGVDEETLNVSRDMRNALAPKMKDDDSPEGRWFHNMLDAVWTGNVAAVETATDESLIKTLSKNKNDLLDRREPRSRSTLLILAVDRLLGALGLEDDDIGQDLSTKYENPDKPPANEGRVVHLIILKLLLAGANPNALRQTSSGRHINDHEDQEQGEGASGSLFRCCFHLAALYAELSSKAEGHEDDRIDILLKTAQLLVQHRATVSAPMFKLFQDSARRGNLSMLQFLILTAKIDPNTKGRQGLTPLHFAARSGQSHVVRWLLSIVDQQSGAMLVDIDEVDDRGKTALDYAKVNHKEDIVELLQKQ